MSSINADNHRIFAKILSENDTFLFDCDGVLWQHDEIVAGAKEALVKLHELGKKVLFVTNNSTKTRAQYLKKIQNYGIKAELNEVFSTSYTSALYLKSKLGPSDEVYIVGTEALTTELGNFGIKGFGHGPDTDINTLHFDTSVHLNPRVRAVIVGMDGHFHFSKVTKAISYLRKKECLYIATNMDPRFPTHSEEYNIPGTGAMVTAVTVASGRKPTVICGKPESFMIEVIKAEVEFNPSRAIMIGDRLDTDILFGKNNNLQTMLTMCGVTSYQELEQLKQTDREEERKMIPDYFIHSIKDFLKYL